MATELTDLASNELSGAGLAPVEVLDLASTHCPIEVRDAPFAPSLLATSAHRLHSFRRGPSSLSANMVREPFQTLAEVLHVPGRFALTVRIGIRGTRTHPQVESDLLVAGIGGDEVAAEVAAAQRQVEEHLGGAGSPFRISRTTREDLGWPTTGAGAFVRQQLLRLGDANGYELPMRFSFPGPDAPVRLLRSLLAAGPGTDLFVTVTPTTLWAREQSSLEDVHRASGEHELGATVIRDAATAIDALLSYRTDLYVLQLLVVSKDPIAEVTLRSIASSITAPYDAERRLGTRIVARPDRFVGGGFEIEPCRDPDEVLRWLGLGMPWIGFRGDRELVDLVTSTEVGFAFSWLADAGGGLPGVGEAAGSGPVVAAGPGVVELGVDDDGVPVRLADTDRHLHTVLVGATGCGKTSLFVDLAVQDAEAGRTVVVVDPHGDLAARVAARLPTACHERTYCLDSSSGDLDQLNLLRVFPPTSDRQHAVTFALVDGMVADLNRDFAGPVFQRVMRRLLHVASINGGTMLDVEHYLAEPQKLTTAAAATGRDDLMEMAAEVRDWADHNRAEMATYVAGKLEWLSSPGLKGTFAQPTSTFDLPEALQQGAVILVTPTEDQRSGEVAMSTFLEALLCCFTERRGPHPTISLYLDEVQRYCGHVVRRLANELRKRSVALHAATQNLTNLGEHLEGLIGNAGNLIVGRSSGPTAMYVETMLGASAAAMARLPNFRAVARLTTHGHPSEPFQLTLAPPTGPPTPELPAWLVRSAQHRRSLAS